ncbi:exodeoxyribonuclease VII large subunit [Nocardioides gansuensis]|uniref:Exodeoxyribonuclease 7 large subunit n=1 Tax=Nocardioides gansuensis TaxID=2138300 RepID=A0A2T8F7D0_9ACTN|nr:exodeoxyribonuclease VII large subunit [Nocardioides gansuensis]PVG81624.1 exodeoxyribonuclease VII large subunit [Nocardioides gansuensis]
MPSLRESTPESPAPVRAVANAVAQWIDRLGAVWVEGQIAQVTRRPGVGTVFMTLRDTVADISVTLTCQRSLFDSLNPPLVEGASVVVHARPSFYANRGSFSLAARDIRMVGLGELLARLERRRQLLAAEGLFAAELKRDLPFLPGVVGLVTAPGSAAERDILDNARRRWPSVRFDVVHAAMQGPRCAAEVMDALDRLERRPEVDVVVVARGGGSVEDLLPFSDEALVRAVHAMRTPLVSAIGHEQDQPLLDLVADVRASTPTDAAKLVVPDMAEELRGVTWARDRLRQLVVQRVAREQELLDQLRARPAMADPRVLLDARWSEVAELRDRARRCLSQRIDRAADDVGHHRARARALSPLETLRRGYAVLQDADGHVVTSVSALATGAPVSVRVADGRVHATTTTIEPLDANGSQTAAAQTGHQEDGDD